MQYFCVICSTSLPGGNQVDGLPPASSPVTEVTNGAKHSLYLSNLIFGRGRGKGAKHSLWIWAFGFGPGVGGNLASAGVRRFTMRQAHSARTSSIE